MLRAKSCSAMREVRANAGLRMIHDGLRGRLSREMHLFLRARWPLFSRTWLGLVRDRHAGARLSVTGSHERRRMHPFLRTCWRHVCRPVRLRNTEVVGLVLVDVLVSLGTRKLNFII